MGTLSAEELRRLEGGSTRRRAAVDRMRSTRIEQPLRGGASRSAHGGGDRAGTTIPLAHAVRDGNVSIADLLGRDDFAEFGEEAIESAAIEIRYEGYIERQMREVERASRSERLEIPESLYAEPLRELSSEGREKILRLKPRTLAQASRIPGVSPADVSVLVVYAERERRSCR